MTRGRSRIASFLPWAGLIFGLVAVGFVHQFGSAGMFNDCANTSPAPLWIVAGGGSLLCTVAGAASWISMKSERGARRVVGAISVGSAALFLFAIILPTIAAALLPACFE